MQNAKLFVFDETGKYIRKISNQGYGAGEYIEFKDFTITNDSHIVISDYRRLLKFDSEGKFLYSTKLNQSFSADEILHTPKNDIIAFLVLPTLFQNHLLSKIDKEGNQELFFDRGETAAIKCNLLTT